ncbi:MAG TPA: hypothetical protein VJM11_05375 [Nevskiaceae bacterium]|nr:hypothetical protein [Nevskiaceae bacterium]
MRSNVLPYAVLLLCVLCLTGTARAAGPAPFDLAGPTLDVVVQRNKIIRPASEVPNLAEGDKLWIKAQFPKTQAANYLMVAAFLRGSTNPPPEDWFFPCKTWTGKCARDGLDVTVPKGAKQMVVLLAPATNGDMNALVKAIRGRPGAFVRATQDLNQASLDRSRLERYLVGVRALGQGNPTELEKTAPLLARSLSIKVDERCLEKMPQLQAACLTQAQEALILNDLQTNSIAQTLVNGPGSDLVMAVSSTPELGYGIYSPYIASVLDIVRILDSFSTAQYQYIPALVSHQGDDLQLTLNAVPSFQEPKSVLVIAMPAIDKAQMPPMHPVDPKQIYCASSRQLVLPVQGAPLAFSTRYAHDVTLTLQLKNGEVLRLPARPDATKGGYVVNTAGLSPSALGDQVKGSLQGYWGFEPWQGPSFELRNAHSDAWSLAPNEDGLVAGRLDTVHLQSSDTTCVDSILFRDPSGKELKVDWKPVNAKEVEVKLPLQNVKPGEVTLLVALAGGGAPQPVPINVFSDAGRLDTFTIHAGDAKGVLRGGRLDMVASLAIGGVTFAPGELSTDKGTDVLPMLAQDAAAAAGVKAERGLTAKVTLKDGRQSSVPVTVDPPRPRVALIGKSVKPSKSSSESNIQLADREDQLPHDARLTFSLRAQTPSTFTRATTIEVATADGAFSKVLSIDNGGLRLEDRSVALGTLDPQQAFGFSAFGALSFRPVVEGVAGDWVPLATLVRLPSLQGLACPENVEQACKLTGTDLFLVESVSGSPGFEPAVRVAEGFPGGSLPVPHPTNGRLYVKLRDDPSEVNVVALQAQVLPPPPADETVAAEGGATAAPGPTPAP